MTQYNSHFILDKIQIKSLKKARLLAKLLSMLEEEFGIKTCKITISNSFICPDIVIDNLGNTPMESCIKEVLLKLK